MGNEVAAAGIRDWFRMLIGRLVGLRVQGDSMSPTLRPGDKILVDPQAAIRTGDIVAAGHPFKTATKVVKRVLSLDEGRVFLSGDNPAESTDSRAFGTVGRDQLLGKVVARL